MDTRNPDRTPGAALTPQEEHDAAAHANGTHEYGCPDGCPDDPETGWPPFGTRTAWTGDGLTFVTGGTNYLTGAPIGPDRGTVPGARIDAAVAEALAAFWRVISDRFPEATAGDMAPGDTDPLDAAALTVARTWIMWNVPGGMPD